MAAVTPVNLVGIFTNKRLKNTTLTEQIQRTKEITRRIKTDSFFPAELFTSVVPFVMKWLPYKDRIALEGTCNAWRRAGKADGWKDLNKFSTKQNKWVPIEVPSFLIRKPFLKLVLSRVNVITQVDFGTEPHNFTSAFQLLLNHSQDTIEVLSLNRGCCTLDLACKISLLPALKTLKLGNITLEMEVALIPAFGRLTHFQMGYNYNTNGDFLDSMNPQIRYLELDGCPYINPAKLTRFLSRSNELEKLCLNGVQDTKVAMIQLCNDFRPKLKELTITPWFSANEDDEKERIAMFSRLTTLLPNLELLKIPRMTNAPPRAIILFSRVYPKLHTLDISEVKFSEHEMRIAGTHMTYLKTLIIDRPNPLWDYKFLYEFLSLETLRMRYLDVTSNIKTIVQYAYHQLNLRTLDLRFASDLNAASPFNLLRFRPKPLTVYLRGTELSDNVYPGRFFMLEKTVLDLES